MIQLDDKELLRQTAENLAARLAADRNFLRQVAQQAWSVMPDRDGVAALLKTALDEATQAADALIRDQVKRKAEELLTSLRDWGWVHVGEQKDVIRASVAEAVKGSKTRLVMVMRGAVKDIIGERAEALLGRIFAALPDVGERAGVDESSDEPG